MAGREARPVDSGSRRRSRAFMNELSLLLRLLRLSRGAATACGEPTFRVLLVLPEAAKEQLQNSTVTAPRSHRTRSRAHNFV